MQRYILNISGMMLFLGVTLVHPLHGSTGPGQSVFRFIGNDAGARYAALGGSGVALRLDPAIIFYNPAGIYMMTDSEISISYLRHIVDINQGFISYVGDFTGYGVMGAGVSYIHYGTQTERDFEGNTLGTFTGTELALLLSYANRLYDDNVIFGVSGKFFYSGLHPDYRSTGGALDFGIQYLIPEQDVIIGIVLLNFGTQFSTYHPENEDKEPLPLDLKLGISKGLEHLPLVLSLNFHHLQEKTDNIIKPLQNFTLGGEFTMTETIRLRLGYRNEMRRDLSIGSAIGLAGFTGGLGVYVGTYRFDYGFSSIGKIGTYHHITINHRF